MADNGQFGFGLIVVMRWRLERAQKPRAEHLNTMNVQANVNEKNKSWVLLKKCYEEVGCIGLL